RRVVVLDVQAERAAQPDLEVLTRVDVARDVFSEEARRSVVGLLGAGLQVEEVGQAGERLRDVLLLRLERELLLLDLVLKASQRALPLFLGAALLRTLGLLLLEH